MTDLYTYSLFDFSGKRNRLSYFVVVLGLTLYSVAVLAVLPDLMAFEAFSFETFFLLAVALWIYLSVSVQRFADIGVRSWVGIGILIASSVIPVFSIFVLLVLLLWPPKATTQATLARVSTVAASCQSTKRSAGNGFEEPKPTAAVPARSSVPAGGLSPFGDKVLPKPDKPERPAVSVAGSATVCNQEGFEEDVDTDSIEDESDSQLYLQAHEELSEPLDKNALWVKCLTLADGDDQKARFDYVKKRVEVLKRSLIKEAEELASIWPGARHRQTELLKAMEQNDTEKCELLLQAGVSPLLKVNPKDKTAYALAMERNWYSMILAMNAWRNKQDHLEKEIFGTKCSELKLNLIKAGLLSRFLLRPSHQIRDYITWLDQCASEEAYHTRLTVLLDELDSEPQKFFGSPM